MTDRYLVTCALPYANGPLHVGHIRSTYLPGDIYARYLRLRGKESLFICSTDEHGTPITVSAEKEGISPIKLAEKYHKVIKGNFEELNIKFDHFSRTSSPTNIKNAQEFFTEAEKNGHIYTQEVDQYYCEHCSRFLPDRYVEGECPDCGAEGARGDHCEKCAQALSELVKPRCMLCSSKPEMKKTEHWFFKLTSFKGELSKFLDSDDLPDNVKNYAVTWLEKLEDWCITRDLDWGVPVPVKNSKGKVLYVWWDAPIGYISATEEWGKKTKKDWEKYWTDSKIVHFIGKDIIYHHALFWPAMLKAHGKYSLPWTIPAGEFLSLEGKKMSTSRNWVIWIDDFLKDYPADYLRYYLTINSPLDSDMDFSWDDFQARINNELSDVIGNFVHRVLTFIEKFYEGKVPEQTELNDADQAIIEKIQKTPDDAEKHIEKFKFMDALKEVLALAAAGNQYLNEKAPWKNKEDGTPLNLCASIVNSLAIQLSPFMPETAQKIWEQLGREGLVEEQGWENAKDLLEAGHAIGKPSPLIEKVEIEETEAEFSGKKVLVDKDIKKAIDSKELSVALAELTGINVKRRSRPLEREKKEVLGNAEKTRQKTMDSYRYLLEERDRGTEGLSSENLIKFVEESKMLPNINTVTDIYNIQAFKTGLIMGVYDAERISGNVRLKVTDGREKFTPIGSSRPAKIEKNEYVLADEDDNVITRWLTKENERVKVTLYTRNAIVCVQGNKDIPQKDIEKALETVCKKIVEVSGGRYKILYPSQ
ncbi:TPA: methionine--tRNA ligase [archaeon]|uniref:Methionine--tRNA ligase n=1 Tax=Candidatus Undinarchaeum marinum TaxID=2756141 RepID=A0A832UME4_9ARCH|nr:methionine--tRNA ligase [Candidatus Undinarchaeum marinum]